LKEDLKHGVMQSVLSDWHQQGGEFSLVYPNQKFLPPKTRVFLDFFAAELKNAFE
jgi:DNA-binding transcriptional LysR family regulator